MNGQKVIAIFDIGKTNKKFFLFDMEYNPVLQETAQLPEIEDENGFPSENLQALTEWIQRTLNNAMRSNKYRVTAINFSSYGASMVHLDINGRVLTPLYNYLKPVPENLLSSFYSTYGNKQKVCAATASPESGNMLNAGLQLYWLKKRRPTVFSKIRWSLHLPQYLSYSFTGSCYSDYTSVGCHTLLWDYPKKNYHSWVQQEGLIALLPPLVGADRIEKRMLYGKEVAIGMGIHDSSAALLPYFLHDKKPFLLLSTGTWSVTMNPFHTIASNEVQEGEDILNYMRPDGSPVKATRFFMGETYKKQVNLLQQHFKKEPNYHQNIRLDTNLYERCLNKCRYYGKVHPLNGEISLIANSDLSAFNSFEEAYHELMLILVKAQKMQIDKAMGSTTIEKIFIDGGFAHNAIFVKLLANGYPDLQVYTAAYAQGSALGAALALNYGKHTKSRFAQKLQLKDHSMKMTAKPNNP